MSDVAPSTVATKIWQPAGFPMLLERYQVLGIIGQGGMGTVFKGYHTNLKRFVAIKILRLDRTKGREAVHRFLREMAAIGQMDHPNVVRASDGGEKNGVLHLVMEYLTGTDLSRLVADRGRLEAADACELARQAAVGLDYIHQTLIHRDIKPSNLMLTTGGLVKILDLGLARLHEAKTGDGEHTPEGCVMGTYDYMAPEQAEAGASIDGRADVYSLGCTLFKLLTSRAPFSGPEYDTLAKKLFGHCHVPLTAVEGFHGIPEEVRAVLLRMTAKDPAERYASARQVAQALAPLAAGSRPSQLLGDSQRAVETALQPLPQPLPEELSRLTDPVNETPMKTDSALSLRRRRALFSGRRLALLGAGLLAAALAALAWHVVPALFHRPAESDPRREVGNMARTGPRALDELAAHKYHLLLEHPPLPVGCEADDLRNYRWDRDQQVLDTRGLGTILFLLGTTSRTSFTLEAGIEQAPWTGNVGLFWGYHEDPAVKSARTAQKEFAWFQMILIDHFVGPQGARSSVVRCRAAVVYDERGDLRIRMQTKGIHDVPRLVGDEKILQIAIERDRLRRACLGSVELTDLCTDQAAKTFAADPNRGGLGVITLAQSGSFRNVRFMALSKN